MGAAVQAAMGAVAAAVMMSCAMPGGSAQMPPKTVGAATNGGSNSLDGLMTAPRPAPDRVADRLEYDRGEVPFQPGEAIAVEVAVQRPTAEQDASRQPQQQKQIGIRR
jgi:hypothetical protein